MKNINVHLSDSEFKRLYRIKKKARASWKELLLSLTEKKNAN